MKIKIFGTLIVILALSLTVCEPDKDDDPECDCLANATREPDVPCCKGKDCTCPIAEPDIKTFSVSFDFQDPTNDYDATIQDARIAAGSANLQQLGIVTKIEDAVRAAFTAGGNSAKDRLRRVFANSYVTIYVDNPATFYKAKALNSTTIYFHIDYLASISSADLQAAIVSLVNAMDPMNPNVPFNVE